MPKKIALSSRVLVHFHWLTFMSPLRLIRTPQEIIHCCSVDLFMSPRQQQLWLETLWFLHIFKSDPHIEGVSMWTRGWSDCILMVRGQRSMRPHDCLFLVNLRNTWRDFPQIWHKHPFRLKYELIRIWCSKVRIMFLFTLNIVKIHLIPFY